MLRILNEKKIEKVIVSGNDKLKIGNIQINILSPPKDIQVESDDIANANSIISLISVSKENYLFMGDATKETEKYLINNIYNIKEANERMDIINKLSNLYVLQIGHHGSKTSTSEYFLNNIKTKNAIISSKRQMYGHPAKETLNILKKYNIRYYITEYKGALKF